MEALVIAPFSGFFLCSVALFLLLRSPLVRFFADAPDHRKVHLAVVPRFGGVAIILSFLALAASARFVPGYENFPALRRLLPSLAFSGFFLLAAGTLDDLRPVHFKVKFALQFALAGILVFALGNRFEAFSLLGHHFHLGGLGMVISLLWFVGLMNAFNMIDGIDGLAGGVALCGFTAVALVCYGSGHAGLALLCLALIGITSGFLIFNLSPTHKVFLGDTGSQFLGAVLGLLAMHVQALPGIDYSLFIPVLIVGYPILDVGVAMTRRFIRCGATQTLAMRFQRMFLADNEHLHHRLVYLGHSHLQSAFLLTVVAATFSASAFILAKTDWRGTAAVLGYLSVAFLFILNRLGYLGRRSWLSLSFHKSLPDRLVGVIEPEDLLFHSLANYRQDKFDFLALPARMTKFMGEDLSAVILYNSYHGKFEEQWTALLRAREVQDCPAIVIAGEAEIAKVRELNPEGFENIRFMEKPVRIPDLIRELELISRKPVFERGARPQEQGFSLAELAMRRYVRQ